MNKGYRIFLFVFLAAGLVLSVLSGTDICNFGGCSEVHQYRLFGLSFPAIGIAFFGTTILLLFFARRVPAALWLLNLLLAGAAGSEINMILLQKNVVKAWCPLCLGIAAVVYLLTLTQLGWYFKHLKESPPMFRRSLAKPLTVGIAFLVGFAVSFTGMAKPEAVAAQVNYSLGKQDSPLEVYFFSDWLCPICVKVEPVFEAAYPALSQKARIFFVDKIIHPEAVNFVPYHLSFLANEKGKYLLLRKTLFGVAQKTKNPSFETIKAAITPLGVTYKQLSFMDVTQQMSVAQKLAEQFKVTATPTLVLRNVKSGKVRTLVGNNDITAEKLARAVKELE